MKSTSYCQTIYTQATKYSIGNEPMKRTTRSILEELNSIHRTTDNEALIQSTGNNLIESSINLLNRITDSYDADTAAELERRFINSIRSGDPRKFKRGVDKIVESRKSDDS